MWPARLAVALLLAGRFLLAASPACAEWLADAEGGLVYEDNLNRAARERDEKSDLVGLTYPNNVFRASFGHSFQGIGPSCLANPLRAMISGWSCGASRFTA